MSGDYFFLKALVFLCGILLVASLVVPAPERFSPQTGRCTEAPVSGVPKARLEAMSRGINLPFWFWFGPEEPQGVETRFNDVEFADLRTLGFTYVRLPVDMYLLLDPEQPGRLNSQWLAQLDLALDRLLKSGLAVMVDLQNLAPDSQGQEYGERLETSNAFIPVYLEFWKSFAAHLSQRNPDQVFLELMNEPVFRKRPSRWLSISEEAIKAARVGAPEHTLVVSGPFWANIDGLLLMTPTLDRNVVYNFHYYAPYPFTHQGADWSADSLRTLRGVPYPSTPQRVKPLLSPFSMNNFLMLGKYGGEWWGVKRIQDEIGRAAAWACKMQVPLIANEFGVYKPFAIPADREQWLYDVRTSLEADGIGWAMWEYDGSFGLVDRDVNGLHLDLHVARALGLQTWALSGPAPTHMGISSPASAR